MRKIIIILFLSLLICAKEVGAQNTTRAEFSNLYNSYRQKYDEYVVAHDEYLLAKSQYEKFDTLTSRENAQKETAEMLILRDEVMVYYLTALKGRLDDTSLEMSDQIKSDRKSSIESEIKWYNEHKVRIKKTQTLKDLVILSNESDGHYTSNNNVVYLTLFEISRARMIRYSNRFGDLYQKVKDLTQTIKAERRNEYKLSDAKMERIDRWIGEVDNKTGEYDNKIIEAEKFTPQQGDRNKSRSLYGSATQRLEEALIILKQQISYVNEVITEIKISEK